MRNLPVKMALDSLEHIPAYELPEPYELRPYRRGDLAAWLRIHARADIYNRCDEKLFREQFGNDEKLLAQRQLYLCDGANEIGTATAWFGEEGPTGATGRVHWVAIVPDYQGRGLSKPLLSATLLRLRELGHTRAFLTTSTPRKQAISLYEKFGFVQVPAESGAPKRRT
jgi:GNAT superfamily N-acetyltransferase